MKKLIFILFIIHCSILIVNAQVTQEWFARYNGTANGYDYASSIALDSSGDIYITGQSAGTGTGYDYVTIKYNSSGIQQWATIYNGPGNSDDYATSIVVDGSNNIYVTGYSTGLGTGYDYVTIKYNSSGVQQWIATYNGVSNSSDYGNSIAVDGSNNVYVTGYSTGLGTGYDYATIKYNSSGVQQWVVIYNRGNSNDCAKSIAVDGSGNILVSGSSHGSFPWDVVYITIKYNSAGIQQWAAANPGIGEAMVVDTLGNVYVTGCMSLGLGCDYGTVKYSPSGVLQWTAIYSAPEFNSGDYAMSIAVDRFGNICVTGTSDVNSYSFATVKYDSSGVQQWVAMLNGGIGYSIVFDASGNVYVSGVVHNTWDYRIIKYNSTGIQQWTVSSGGAEYAPPSIAVNKITDVYLTGGWGSSSSADYITRKYSQPIEILQIFSEIPELFSLEQNYPNPFNPNTVIAYQLAVNSYTILKVFDLLGREVITLVNEKQNAGSYSVDFDGANYPSGIYYYKLVAGDFSEVRKMILLK